MLQKCELAELGDLRHEYARGNLSTEHPVLLIRFRGKLSNEDNRDVYALARARVLAGLEAWQPWALILDFAHLDYEWGDEMAGLIATPQQWYRLVYPVRKMFNGDALPSEFPLVVVTSDSNRAALESLLRDVMKVESRLVLYSSLGDAVRALEGKLADVPCL